MRAERGRLRTVQPWLETGCLVGEGIGALWSGQPSCSVRHVWQAVIRLRGGKDGKMDMGAGCDRDDRPLVLCCGKTKWRGVPSGST